MCVPHGIAIAHSPILPTLQLHSLEVAAFLVVQPTLTMHVLTGA